MLFVFFNDTATTEIYTLSLHDALPISQETYLFHSSVRENLLYGKPDATQDELEAAARAAFIHDRSEEHTSELQSRQYLVCRLLLEKKKRPFLLFIFLLLPLCSPLLLTS